ncbi:hypothetical protein [Photobacterium profundum]|uniref:hypothetical protein n=1 Tax=Photobacterium profundum TaxID=74109 RepID=UPI003D0F87B6
MKHKYILILALSLLSSKSFANTKEVEGFDAVVPEELTCSYDDMQPACFYSSEIHNDDFFIYVRDNSYQKEKFDHESYIWKVINEANVIYSSFNKRTLEFNRKVNSPLGIYFEFGNDIENRIIVVIDFKFQDRSLTAIHDSNDSVYVDYDDRIDYGNLLKVHRKVYGNNKRKYFNEDKLANYFTSGKHTTKTSTYNVFSTPVEKNIETGEVKVTGKKKKTNRLVQHTRTVSYQASYFNLEE